MKKIFICILLCIALLLSGCDKTKACTHTDSDDNGVCDTCEISVLVPVDFYVINDLHGKFADTDEQVGVDELTTYLKTVWANDEHFLLLSTGDMWQGSSESNTTEGLIITDWMNELGFNAMTLGNHEFDWGEDAVELNDKSAQFPFLAINIYDRKTDKPVEYAQPSVIVDKGEVQIGIIGAIGDCYSSIAPEQVEDIYFKVDDDLTALVKAESQRLREQGADIIVYSLHDGYEHSKNGETEVSALQLSPYYDISLSDGYVDVVFEAHTHQKYIMTDRFGVYHIQSGGENDGLAHIELAYNSVSEKISVNSVEFVPTSAYSTLADDPIVDKLMAKYDDEIADTMRSVGYNTSYRNSNQLRQLVANLYYEKGIERWGDDYDIVLGGGFMSVRSPYSLPVGEVTYSDLQMLFPFDNELVLCSIKGRDLSSKFFYTTNDKYFIAYGDYGESVKNNIDPDKTYYVVVDTYTSTYAPNRLTEIERYGEEIYARDLLADYFEDN